MKTVLLTLCLWMACCSWTMAADINGFGDVGNDPNNLNRSSQCLAFDEDYIYFAQGNKIVQAKQDGSNAVYIGESDGTVEYLNVYDGWLYYCSIESGDYGSCGYVWRINLESHEEELLWQEAPDTYGNTVKFVNMLAAEEYLFVGINGMEDGWAAVYTVNLQTKEAESLVYEWRNTDEEYDFGITVSEGNVYILSSYNLNEYKIMWKMPIADLAEDDKYEEEVKVDLGDSVNVKDSIVFVTDGIYELTDQNAGEELPMQIALEEKAGIYNEKKYQIVDSGEQAVELVCTDKDGKTKTTEITEIENEIYEPESVKVDLRNDSFEGYGNNPNNIWGYYEAMAFDGEYVYLNDGNGILRVKQDGSDGIYIGTCGDSLNIMNGYLYCTSDEGKIRKIDLASFEESVLFEYECESMGDMLGYGEYLYCVVKITEDYANVFAVNTESGQSYLLLSGIDRDTKLTVSGDMVYAFVSNDSYYTYGRDVYRMNISEIPEYKAMEKVIGNSDFKDIESVMLTEDGMYRIIQGEESDRLWNYKSMYYWYTSFSDIEARADDPDVYEWEFREKNEPVTENLVLGKAIITKNFYSGLPHVILGDSMILLDSYLSDGWSLGGIEVKQYPSLDWKQEVILADIPMADGYDAWDTLSYGVWDDKLYLYTLNENGEGTFSCINSDGEAESYAIQMSETQSANVSVFLRSEEHGGFQYDLYTDNHIELKEYTGSSNDVVVPAEINGYKVTSVGSYAFSSKCKDITSITFECELESFLLRDANEYRNLKKVVLPKGISCIGEYAFWMCDSLETVEIPETVTEIRAHAFEWCTSLKEISALENVEVIGEYAFSECNVLENVQFSEGLREIGANAFEYCNALTSISFPDSLVSIGGGAFYGCRKIEKVEFGEGLETIGGSAFFCTGITKVILPDSVTSIGEAAFSGTDLVSITLGNGLTSVPDEMCYSCNDLEKVNLGTAVTELGEYAFAGSGALTDIYIPDQVQTIMKNTFNGEYEGTPLERVKGSANSLAKALADYYEIEYIETFSADSVNAAAGEEAASQEAAQSGNVTPPTTDASYLIESSSDAYLTDADISGLDYSTLVYARYEIYARKGVTFEDETVNGYFNQKDWYFGFIGEADFSENMLNEYETANVELLDAAIEAAEKAGTAGTASTGNASTQTGAEQEEASQTETAKTENEQAETAQTESAKTETDQSETEKFQVVEVTEETEAQPVSKYLFEDGNSRILTDSEVSALSLQAVCYAKNEFYARHGRKFLSVELQEYFGSKSWYQGTVDPANFSTSVFNDYEVKNIDKLAAREQALQSGGYVLDQPGYDIHAVDTGAKAASSQNAAAEQSAGTEQSTGAAANPGEPYYDESGQMAH